MEKESRRLDMPCLKGIPEEVLMDCVTNKSNMPNIVEMTRQEIDDEVVDLVMERRYLVASVEYLKNRLAQLQKSK